MTTAVLRQELHTYSDIIPTQRLTALKPLLADLAEPLYTVEAANADEIALIDEGMDEYRANPASFVPLETVPGTICVSFTSRVF